MADEEEYIRPNPHPRPVPKKVELPPDDDYTDVKLLERFVNSARSNKLPKGKDHRLWEAVAYNAGLPDQLAKELCARFGLNPDLKVKRE